MQRAIARGAPGPHARGAGVSNEPAQSLYRALRLRARPAIRKGYYAETKRGRPRHVGPRHRHPDYAAGSPGSRPSCPATSRRGAGSMTGGRILGIETSCDETAAAVVDRRRHRVLSSVVSQPGRPPRPLRRRRARDRQPRPRRPAHPGRGPGARRGRRRTPDGEAEIDAVAATVGPGLIGALLVGVSAAKALALAWDVPFVGVNHLEAHLYAALPRRARPRAAARGAARVGRPHACSSHGGPRPVPAARARPSTTPPARRSTRSPATSASATRAARPSTAWRVDGRPGGHPVPAGDARRRHLRLLLLRAEDGGGQPRAQAPRGRRPPTWPPLPGGRGRRAGRQGPPGGRARSAPRACAWAAAWPPTRCCASGSSTPARRTASAASCPAGPCAPTTPPWSAAPALVPAGRATGPTPLDTAAIPNLGHADVLSRLRSHIGLSSRADVDTFDASTAWRRRSDRRSSELARVRRMVTRSQLTTRSGTTVRRLVLALHADRRRRWTDVGERGGPTLAVRARVRRSRSTPAVPAARSRSSSAIATEPTGAEQPSEATATSPGEIVARSEPGAPTRSDATCSGRRTAGSGPPESPVASPPDRADTSTRSSSPPTAIDVPVDLVRVAGRSTRRAHRGRSPRGLDPDLDGHVSRALRRELVAPTFTAPDAPATYEVTATCTVDEVAPTSRRGPRAAARAQAAPRRRRRRRRSTWTTTPSRHRGGRRARRPRGSGRSGRPATPAHRRPSPAGAWCSPPYGLSSSV